MELSDRISRAVYEVWDLVLNKGIKDTRSAATELWESLSLDEEDVRYLAIFGLSELAKRKQREQRENGRVAIAIEVPSSGVWESHLASLTSVYDNAQGLPRPLFEFTVEDWLALEIRMRILSKSYSKRAELASIARQLLVSTGATKTSDLPEDELRRFADQAHEVLTREVASV